MTRAVSGWLLLSDFLTTEGRLSTLPGILKPQPTGSAGGVRF
jgi:hypothetical protein